MLTKERSMNASDDMQRRPMTYVAKKSCKCGSCGNRIYAFTTVAKVNGKVVCEPCSDEYVWNNAQQRWELKAK